MILGGLAVFVIRPKVNDVISLYKQKQEKEIELRQSQQKEKDLEKLKDTYKEVENQLSKLYQAFPSEKEVSDLVIQIEATALETGNTLKTIQLATGEEGETKSKEETSPFTQTRKSEILSGAYEIPLKITLGTDFHKLLHFLEFLENLSRYIDVTSLSIKVDKDNNTIEVDLSLVSYIKP
jgi:Tfp pilus assembly protein PilO